jgi:hypothetical protein
MDKKRASQSELVYFCGGLIFREMLKGLLVFPKIVFWMLFSSEKFYFFEVGIFMIGKVILLPE